MTSRKQDDGAAGPGRGAPDFETELDRTMAEAAAAVEALGHGGEDDEGGAPASDTATRDAVEDALAERIAELEEELEKAKGELDTTKDRWLRAVADHENYKKRQKRETDEAVLRNTQSLLTSFLPTVDNLERALEIGTTSEETPGLEQVLKGLQMVRDDFLAALKRQGIDPVDAVGVPFDPAVHDALQQLDSPDHAPGVVIREFEKGYKMGDRLLRPARVIVAGAGSGGGRKASEPES
jgi:molecular chaperone GrpE